MTKEELAAEIDGNEYGSETTNCEARAKASGLVVIFGYSDDNVELRGAIDEEIGACDGTKFTIDGKGILPPWDDFRENETEIVDYKEYFERLPKSREIEAVWHDNGSVPDGYAWTFKTDIPHAEFGILEDGEKFCRGIVIDMADLA